MKRIALFFLISMALTFVFVCTKDKPVVPPWREDPAYYYPRQKDYSWRYIYLGKGCTASGIADSFDLTILGANTRHGDVGYDRYRGADTNSITFIFRKVDTLFAEQVGQTVPLDKILVGPIKAGTFWRDSHFEYLIQGFENVTLNINGETYKRCAKILKTNRNHPEYNKFIEWWAPQYGKVKKIEVDTLGVCQSAEELRYFTKTGEFP